MADIHGTTGSETLDGTANADVINGNAGDDTLNGGGDNDRLLGESGNDVLNGGSGDDALDGGTGSDVLNGGDGFDAVLYSSSSAGVVFTAGAPAESWAGPGGDQLISIERIWGSDFGDTLDVGGASGSVELWGASGDDILTGGAGRDILVGQEGNDTIIVAHTISPGDVLEGDEGFDTVELHVPTTGTLGYYWLAQTLLQVEQLRFVSTASTTVYASIQLRQVTDQEGGGQLTHLTGGAGTDILSIAMQFAMPGSYTVPEFTLANWGPQDNISLYLSVPVPGDFTLNAREGLAGTQSLGAADGNDTLNGSSGSDVLSGNAGNDVLTGFGGNDVLVGGLGRDRLDGGDGNDIASYTMAGAAVTVNLARSTAQNTGGADADLLLNVEGLAGSGFDDRLTGNALANMLSGGAGNDTLDGGAGADDLRGGAGNDIYLVDDAGDAVVELANEGIDRVNAAVDFTLGAELENLVLRGSAQFGSGNALDNAMLGSSGKNTLAGLAGNDTLDGGTGFDTLDGGDGNDILTGGIGKDRLTGGAGLDQFVFRDGDVSVDRTLADVVTDFSHAEGDRLKLSAMDANTGLAGDQKFAFIGAAAFTGVAGQLHYVIEGGNTYVEGDTNGDGTADLVIRLVGTINLTAADFVL